MLRTSILRTSCKRLLPTGLVIGALFAFQACSDDYDWAQEKPSWLGESIYGELQSRGNFSIYLKMADELGQAEFLKQTGSVTVFVTDDDAYRAYFQKHGIDENNLSPAVKKNLVNANMLENAYVLDLLTNESGKDGVVKGQLMRRGDTRWSIFDSIPAMGYGDIPEPSISHDWWKGLRSRNMPFYNMAEYSKNGVLPMIHFIWRHMMTKGITKSDFSYLFNGAQFQEDDVYINNVKVREGNVTCQNGYIHIMDDVPTPLPNMAEYIQKNGSTKLFGKFLDRFSAPFVNHGLALSYRLLKENYQGQNFYSDLIGGDSIYQKRYFWSDGLSGLTQYGDSTVSSYLKFDPGQNDFVDAGTYLGKDMGAIFAPTDQAIENYWNGDDGAFLRNRYPSEEPLANVPNHVLAELVNNHMHYSFLNSLPSRFDNVLDDAKDPLGLTESSIVQEYTSVCCNGAVYVMDKVYAPSSFRSVIAPALVEDNMTIMNWAIRALEFKPYLLSMVSYYSFLILTDEALQYYIDPVSYNTNDPRWFRFYYDENSKTVQAYSYRYDKTIGGIAGCIEEGMRRLDSNWDEWNNRYESNPVVANRLTDLLNFCVIPRDIHGGNVVGDGDTYFTTKDNGTARFGFSGSNTGVYDQYTGELIPVTLEAEKDNGIYYVLDRMVQPTFTSLLDVLESDEEFSEFYDLLLGNDNWTSNEQNMYAILRRSGSYTSMNSDNTTVRTFNSYHYTVYVPDNAAMQKAYENGLPRWSDINNLDKVYVGDPDVDVAALKREYTEHVISFLKYHLQDNSVYIGGGSKNSTYETAAFISSGEKEGLCYTLEVNANDDEIVVKGNYIPEWSGVAKVSTDNPVHYNRMIREYSFDVGNTERPLIATSSYAVVHRISEPLLYDKECLCLKENERLP